MENRMRKYAISTIILLLLCITLTGCINNSGTGNETSQIVENTSQLWDVQINRAETASSMEGSQSILQYNGEEETIPVQELPGDGNVFLLLDLTITKKETGKGTFSWKNTYILDEQGNKYKRNSNDTFLQEFGLTRLKNVDITFGTNKGYVCYEVSNSIIKGNLWFIYEAQNGEKIKIKINNIKEY